MNFVLKDPHSIPKRIITNTSDKNWTYATNYWEKESAIP